MRCYLLSYDIRDPRRWRRVHAVAEGYGEPLQYSVFQCILTDERRVELEQALRREIKHDEDAVLLIDLGALERFDLKMTRMGAQPEGDRPGPMVL